MNDLAPIAAQDAAPVEDEAMPAAEQAFEKLVRWADETQTSNISTEIDDGKLTGIGFRAVEEYNIDLESRKKWADEARVALDLALQRSNPKSHPWPGASNVILPILTEAADQFAARAYPAIIADRNVVKGMTYGPDDGIPKMDLMGQPMINPQTGEPVWAQPPGTKRQRADRIGDHMTWQLMEEQPEWEDDTDKMMHVLPIVGCAFRKTYFDPSLGRNCSVYVSALDIVVNYWAKSLATAPRVSEVLKLYPHEIEEYLRSEYFDVRFKVGAALDSNNDPDAPHTFIEQHRLLDLDEDGYAEPYIVTVHVDTQRVARITPRFEREGVFLKPGTEQGTEPVIARIVPVAYYTKYDFLPNKEGGFYGQGFGQLLRPLNEAANTVLNQIIDAATLQNTGGGFIGKGLSLHTGTLSRKMGEWSVINAAGGAIRDAIVPLKHDGPSPVLFQVLGLIMEMSRGVSSVKDVLTGEIKAQTMSPTVFMALVEQGLKSFTSIWKRIHRSFKAELDKLYRLNRIYLEEQKSYQTGELWKTVTRQDYALGSGVEPVSDKNMVSDVQKLSRAEFLATFKDDPRLDGVEIYRRMFEAASITDADKFIKKAPDTNPELIMKIGELELKQMATKATAIREMAAAVKLLADADATVMEPFHQWMMAQFNAMQERINVLSQADTTGSAGTQPGAVQPMEAPSGDAGLSGMVGTPALGPGGPTGPAMGGPGGAA